MRVKKQNGFAADSTKGASETPTTINIPAEMSKAEWTAYEEFFYNNIPGIRPVPRTSLKFKVQMLLFSELPLL